MQFHSMFYLLEKYLRERDKIDDEKLQYIFKHFKRIKTKRNQILLNYDEVCMHNYFINKGCIRIFTVNSTGLESSRNFFFEGSFGTALPSLIDQKPANEYVQTIEPSDLLVISREDYFKLIEEIPACRKIYREKIELGYIYAQQRIYTFQGMDALEKVKWLMKHQPTFLLRVSNKMAASYLGISPSTLSRIKTKL